MTADDALAPVPVPAPSPPPGRPDVRGDRTVSLALVSHTNAGKTTLARTLLRRDVGTVRDAPHVTEFSDAHGLVEAPGGERLVLWDTPGFGDTFRLAKRLRQTAHPIVRFLAEAWDRWRDRPFWASQQALRTVRDDADVLLYLVNASESPAGAGHVRPEMEILAWIGKPVVVLLNQLGPPRAQADADTDVAAWRTALASDRCVRAVLPLDAFARCWVQELTLLETIAAALPADREATMAALLAAWRADRVAAFDASMAALAGSLGRLAAAAEPVPAGATFGDRLKAAGAALRWAKGGSAGDAERPVPSAAERALVRRLEEETQSSTQALLALHGLSGAAERAILDRTAALVDVRLRVDEGQAALWGGALTGAIAGLKADVLSGGLTLGGGLLAGGLLGALGGAGLARAVNIARGTDRSTVAWSTEALDAMVETSLLRYLAVAHFGRGRGDWAEGEAPAHWRPLVARLLAERRDALDGVWADRAAIGRAAAHRTGGGHATAEPRDERGADAAALDVALAERLAPIVRDTAVAALVALYPESAAAALDGRSAPPGVDPRPPG